MDGGPRLVEWLDHKHSEESVVSNPLIFSSFNIVAESGQSGLLRTTRALILLRGSSRLDGEMQNRVVAVNTD